MFQYNGIHEGFNAFVKRKEIHLDDKLYCLLLCVCGFNKLCIKSVIN